MDTGAHSQRLSSHWTNAVNVLQQYQHSTAELEVKVKMLGNWSDGKFGNACSFRLCRSLKDVLCQARAQEVI